MAKNKNRKQSAQQDRASAAERGAQEAKSTSYEAQAQARPESQSGGDVSRKQQKRFGHN
ncbi:hypothetical protein ACPXCE_12765 [Streptomyces sp. DT24]|uniref:hypothetical protein n=1 Tax=unclassified Streptomyces TaxID=2593676 RepID=UPI0023B95B6B|nr:hypothetical protein [Streptomyces sp. AM 4-1-1]WEH32923.1 hypothetical protein PZB75_05745 [Streptomyces sp. AM 4-1-1]